MRVRFSPELAARIRDELFTSHEKELLTYDVGTLHIDIKDQLLHHYGRHYIYQTENEFLHSFAIVHMEKGKPILRQLELLMDRIEFLMQTANGYESRVFIRDTDTTTTSESDSFTTDDQKSREYSYGVSDEVGKSKGGAVGKNVVAANSEETPHIETQMYKGLHQDTFELDIKKKKINASLNSKDFLTDINLTEDDVVPTNKQPFEPTDLTDTLYATQTLDGKHSLETSKSIAVTEDMGTNVSKSEASRKGSSHSTAVYKLQGNVKKYTTGEADMKAINLEIPQIRTKFWNAFSSLFTTSRIN